MVHAIGMPFMVVMAAGISTVTAMAVMAKVMMTVEVGVLAQSIGVMVDNKVATVKNGLLYIGVSMSLLMEVMELIISWHDLVIAKLLASPWTLWISGLSSQDPILFYFYIANVYLV